MGLSKNFTLGEATYSETALIKNIKNTPNEVQQAALLVAAFGMQLVRAVLGNHVIIPSSWFRVEELNTAVGGSRTSDHMTGFAVDFNCPAFGTLEQIVKAIQDSDILYDQLIIERVSGKEWIHISFAPALRMQTFEISDDT